MQKLINQEIPLHKNRGVKNNNEETRKPSVLGSRSSVRCHGVRELLWISLQLRKVALMQILTDIKDFLTNPALYLSVYMVVAYLSMVWLFVATPRPWGYLTMLLPWIPAIFSVAKEQLRKITLGFVHDRVSELPQERIDEALERYIREAKKNRPLP